MGVRSSGPFSVLIFSIHQQHSTPLAISVSSMRCCFFFFFSVLVSRTHALRVPQLLRFPGSSAVSSSSPQPLPGGSPRPRRVVVVSIHTLPGRSRHLHDVLLTGPLGYLIDTSKAARPTPGTQTPTLTPHPTTSSPCRLSRSQQRAAPAFQFLPVVATEHPGVSNACSSPPTVYPAHLETLLALLSKSIQKLTAYLPLHGQHPGHGQPPSLPRLLRQPPSWSPGYHACPAGPAYSR